MIRWLLRLFGFYRVQWGCSTGRHWIEIDGKTIAQSGDECWLRDEDVERMQRTIFEPPSQGHSE